MCCPPTNQHSGTVIRDLIEHVYGAPQPRRSSVDSGDPWLILVEARTHLCAHVLTAGDVQAWFLMGELQERL